MKTGYTMIKPCQRWSAWAAALVLALYGIGIRAEIAATLGGGNISPDLQQAQIQLKILKELGAGMCRIPVSPDAYGLDDGRPHPERLDPVVLLACQNGIEPILLFEYYTRWHPDLHGHDRWQTIGKAYARRFRPDSPWLVSQNIRGWGIRHYNAINEPTWKSNNPRPIAPAQYAAALEGLADGVHAVDPDLKVSPGGWIEGSLRRGDHSYCRAVAPLFNQGKLHAIGIHRYWDIDYVPMANRYDWSLQSQFEQVKRAAGIHAPVRFYTDEINFKKRNISEDQAACGFLTALWDALGVIGDDGKRVTEFVMPWNIFHLTTRDSHYGLCRQLDPWQPTARGRVFQLVCQLTHNLTFISCDPKVTGVFVLEGPGRKLWVWQNRRHWSTLCGHSFTLHDLPPNATRIDVYAWDGLRRSLQVGGRSTVTIDQLTPEQTYMFLVSGPAPIANPGPGH